jgi:alpha-tubulin suppressor-like RCC1 family protein
MIGCGNQHTIAIGTKDEIYSWGDGTYGQLGYKNNYSSKPKQVFIKLSKT